MGTVFGTIILIADIWAIAQTVQTPVSAGNKILWVLLILILPVVGLLLWFFLGPRPLRQ
ncbi:MAG TPA: PLDc N-terminal domain-containing protein [Geopsychrobacteraceae bacterium]|nr:PLDc N-terminal domain-containing protein [Geopsychrobacteraceae bacterium]